MHYKELGMDYKEFGKKFQGRERTRELTRLRDNHTCQKCYKKWKVGERRFDIHHLNGLCGKKSLSYDRVNEMDGLITYCHKCHLGLDSVRDKMVKAGKNYKINQKRNKIIVKLNGKGKSRKEISNIFSISTERVRQILSYQQGV